MGIIQESQYYIKSEENHTRMCVNSFETKMLHEQSRYMKKRQKYLKFRCG